MATTSYEGMASAMRNSEWLAAEDLLGLGDAPSLPDEIVKADPKWFRVGDVVIEEVQLDDKVSYEGGREVANQFCLKLVGKQKRWPLKTRNRTRLIQLFGNVAKNWKGKTITIGLVAVKNPAGGGKRPGIRIEGAKA